MIKLYMLFVLVVMPNGAQHILPSDPYVFTLKDCHETGRLTVDGILKQYPGSKATHKCKITKSTARGT